MHDLDALLPRSTTVLAGVTAMAVSPDGRTVAVGQDAWVSTIDARTRLPLGHTRWQEGVIKSITYGANGTLHAHGVGSPDLVGISDDLLQHIASVQPIDYSLRAIPLSNGSVLSAHWNRPLVMWRDGKVVRDMGVGRVRDMRVATNGRDVAALDADGRSWTGMFVTGEEGLVACEHVPGATAIAMSDDSAGPMVAVLTETHVIGVCGDISVHSTSGPKLASFATGRQWIVAGAREGTVMAWRRGDPAPRMIARAHDERVSAVVLAPDEAWFATAGWDGRVMFWQLPDDDDPDAATR